MAKTLVALFCAARLLAQDVNLTTVGQIKTEAYDHSQVMDHLAYLTDIYGPRLSGSPEFRQAADWAVKRLDQMGLSNVHLEKWGPFGRGWTAQQYAVEMLEPRYSLLFATPLAWSRSTNGPVVGDLALAPLTRTYDPKKAASDLDAFEKEWKGKLRGRIVLLTKPKTTAPVSKPAFRRYTDAELAELAIAPTPAAQVSTKLADLKFPDDPEDLGKFFSTLPSSTIDELIEARNGLSNRRNKFFNDEGVLGVLSEDPRAHLSLTFAEQAGSQESKNPLAPPTFVVTEEQYNRLTRILEKKVPLKVRMNLKAAISDKDIDGLNIVGEIPGGSKKDEIVMIGAHFDSWHTGTGATDNGAGSAVMMEVMRILKTLDLKMDRTIRIALWSGEEQGLLGSKAYVKEHFGDPKTMQPTSANAKLDGYFNLDNGGGKIRGVYLQKNDAMRPIFEKWLAPFRDEGVSTVSIHNTGGTDHLSFDAIGLPGFQFIQDPLDYGTVTHHSAMDTYDHVIPADLMQASAVIASVVYDAANRSEMLPRKVMPKPSPAKVSAPDLGKPTE